jgi:2-polyprenyl-3-methyl-5-hydroxy-6-metoxy-1,4-benzoquinol methylase
LECGLVFINPRPDKSEISRYYPADYFRCYEEIRGEYDVIQEKKIKITAVKKPGRILDIGCGRGEFLAKMQAKGCEAYGVQLSAVAASYAREKLGLKNIYNQDLLTASLPEGSFDMVTLWHVIEHLTDPSATLKKIHGLLKDDGTLIVNCPNFNSGLRRIFREKWYQLDAPRHLYQFTPRTLRSMLKNSGFEVKSINYMPFPLYSLIWFKMSLFRWLGVGSILYPGSNVEGRAGKERRKGIAWALGRNIFNFICQIIGITFSLSRLGDEVCIKSEKIKE